MLSAPEAVVERRITARGGGSSFLSSVFVIVALRGTVIGGGNALLKKLLQKLF